MNKEGKYNGYTNYETWAVALWMDNEQGSYEHFRHLARVVQLANQRPNQEDGSITMELASCLRREFEEASPVADHSTVFADLMNAALSEVDWYELAEILLREIEEADSK